MKNTSNINKNFTRSFIFISIATALSSMAISSHAFSQEQSPLETEEAQEAEYLSTASFNEAGADDIERITVTGTSLSNRRTSLNTIKFDAEDIENSGALSLDDFLRQLPQNQNKLDPGVSNFDIQATQGTFSDRSGGVNLRGLGEEYTLILVNGRRVSTSSSRPTGGNGLPRAVGTVVDIEAIPLRAIQRIEVVTDGASSIYGSDAVGGVINIILKDDYSGSSITARLGKSSSGADEKSLGLTYSASKGDFSSLISLNYSKELPVQIRGNDYNYDFSEWDQRNLSRPQFDRGASPANLQVFTNVCDTGSGPQICGFDFAGYLYNGSVNTQIPNQFDYYLPNDLNAFPEISDFIAGSPSEAIYLPDVLGPDSESVSFTGNFGYDFSDDTNVNVLALVSKRKTAGAFTPFTIQIDLVDNHPFNPLGSERGAGIPESAVAFYSTANAAQRGDVPFQEFSDENINYTLNVGLTHMLTDTWRLKADFTHSGSDSEGSSVELDTDAYALFLADNNTLRNVVNPFGPEEISPDIINSILRERQREGSNEINYLSAILNGEVGNLPGGSIGLAFGLESRNETFNFQTLARLDPISGEVNSTFCLQNPFACEQTDILVDRSRDVYAAFTEANIPIVGDNNKLPFVDSLSITASARYDRYDEEGTTRDRVSPALGLRWGIVDGVTFRANWNQSFRAPNIVDVTTPVEVLTNVQLFFTDPLNPGITNINTVVTGGNPDLENEIADSYTAGLEGYINIGGGGKSIVYNLNYFSNKVENKILSSFSFQTESFVLQNPELFPDVISRDVSTPNIIESLNRRAFNAESYEVSGLDANITYYHQLPNANTLAISVNATRSLDFSVQELAGLPIEDTVGTNNGPQDLVGNIEVRYSAEDLQAGLTARYNSSFTYEARSTVDGFIDYTVPSYSTVDAFVTYDLPNSIDFLQDSKVALTVTNIFKKQPPFYGLTPTGVSYFNGADPRQRTITLEVSKEF